MNVRYVLGAMLFFVFGMANAVVIDFEDHAVASGGNTIINSDFVSGGFNFDLDSNHAHFLNNWAPDAELPTDNGSTFLLLDNNVGTSMVSASDDGQIFHLQSVDFAELVSVIDTSETVTITGYLSGGGTLEHTFALDMVAGFETVNFNWNNLTGVAFTGNPRAGETRNYLAIDNMVANVVPIPAAVWLFGSALGGLGWMRRRKAV